MLDKFLTSAINNLFGGLGYIAGTAPNGLVTVNGVPSGREIELRHRISRQVVAVSLSHPDGTYRFDRVSINETFDVIGRDWSGTYNDVIVSRVKPEPY